MNKSVTVKVKHEEKRTKPWTGWDDFLTLLYALLGVIIIALAMTGFTINK